MNDRELLFDASDGDHRFAMLLQRYLEGVLSADKLAEFEESLRADDRKRELLVSVCLQQTFAPRVLEHEQTAAEESSPSSIESANSAARAIFERAAKRPKSLAYTIAAITVAACLLIMAAVPVSKYIADAVNPEAAEDPEPREMVAQIVHTEGARWVADRDALEAAAGDSTPGIRLGRNLHPGQRLFLASGMAHFKFYNGADVVLEGPAEFAVHGKKKCGLALGTLVARAVERRSKDFVVETPVWSVKDLGTEFGVAVDDSGSQVHVLSGSVATEFLADSTKPGETRILRANESLRLSPDGRIETKLSKEARSAFSKLRKRGMPSKEPNTPSELLASDRDLLIHYPFHRNESESQLVNHGRGGAELNAKIEGAAWTTGHRSSADALAIDHADDHVRMNVPGEFSELTMMAWVRVDALDQPFHGLVMSEGWGRQGQVHWQIRRDGQIEFAVFNLPSHIQFSAFQLKPQQWYHLAVTCDVDSQRASLFVNGRLVDEQQTPQMPPLVIGAADIGNWTGGTDRRLNGRISEVVLFSRAVFGREVSRVYAASKEK